LTTRGQNLSGDVSYTSLHSENHKKKADLLISKVGSSIFR